MTGRPSKLTPAQRASIHARYLLYQQNRPKQIARELGISLTYVWMIAKNRTRRDKKNFAK